MFNSIIFKIFLLLVIVLGVPGGVIGYRYYTSRPSYLLKVGHEALEKGKWKEAERLILLLEKNKQTEAAGLLRGERLVYAGEASLENEPAAFPYEDVQRAAQMVIAGAGLSDQPPAIRELTWFTGCMFQASFPTPSPSRNYYRQALAELTKIQDDGPIGIKGTVLAAECLIRLGEQRLAAEGLTAILKRDPSNKDAHRFLAAIYIDLNSLDDAIDHLKEWARLDPTDGLPYRWIGFFRKEKNEVTAAREAYEEALRRSELAERSKNDNASAKSWMNDVLKELAEIYITQGDYQLALDTLRRGEDSFFEAPEILTLRIQCLQITNRDQEADELVAKALNKDPNFVPALFLQAHKFWREDQPKLARDLLERAIRQEPYNLKVGSLLMDVCLRMEDRTRADELKKRNDETRQMLQEITDLISQAAKQPWNDGIRLKIGQLHHKLGHAAEARTWLKSCLACNPNNYAARRLLSLIPPAAELKGRPSTESFSEPGAGSTRR